VLILTFFEMDLEGTSRVSRGLRMLVLEVRGEGEGDREGRNTHEGLGVDEVRSIGVVKVRDAFAGEFEVLGLVFADRDVGRSSGCLVSRASIHI
jgi:hypothetical protein